MFLLQTVMIECPEPEFKEGNVSLDYYSLPQDSNLTDVCPMPTPGELESLITIRCAKSQDLFWKSLPSIMLEGVAQALVAILGIAGNIACIVILSRFVMV